MDKNVSEACSHKYEYTSAHQNSKAQTRSRSDRREICSLPSRDDSDEVFEQNGSVLLDARCRQQHSNHDRLQGTMDHPTDHTLA